MTEAPQGISIELKEVCKSFGPKKVVINLSARFVRGEIVLVVGPNGAGKSTLLKIMSGVYPPTEGKVILQVDPFKLAYMGHKTFLYPRLTALENLAFWADIYKTGHDRKRLIALLSRVGLKHVIHDPAGNFSRGMAQRLSLARLLLIDPVLLLLDEPGTGLDQSSRSILTDEIRKARDRGHTVVWVSHDVERDMTMADRVLALQSGRVVYQGPAREYDGGRAICD